MTPFSEGLPRISVVVPSYNQGRFLPEALDSIFRQDYPAVEVVVMDGGSTDDSVNVIRSYAGRLKHWQSGRDGGQSAAINAGMRHATGLVVAWLNSDDFYVGDCLWTVADAYLRFPGHGLYVGNGFRYDDGARQSTPFCRRHLALNRRALTHGLDYVLQPSTFFLKEAWDRAGGLDPALRFGMDWDIILRIARDHPAVLINEFLAASREYDDTKTRSGGMRRAFELCALAGRHAGSELTPGSLYYLFGALLAGGAGDDPGLYGCLAEGLHHIEKRWQAEFGGHDGFPAVGDPQDRLYLPLPGEVRARKPATAADGLPAISIVCTAAGGAVPPATVESVVSQEYPRVEALVPTVGPAGLTDGVRCWRPRRPRSTAAVINEGLALAGGEVLGWLRAGNRLSDAALYEVGAAFAADPALDLVCGNGLCLNDGIGTAFCCGSVSPLAPPSLDWANAFARPLPPIFFRRRLLERAGGLDPSYRHLFDLELWRRFASATKARKIEKTLALFHSPQQDSSREQPGRLAEWRRLRRSLGPAADTGRRGWPRVLGGLVRDYLRQRLRQQGRKAAG